MSESAWKWHNIFVGNRYVRSYWNLNTGGIDHILNLITFGLLLLCLDRRCSLWFRQRFAYHYSGEYALKEYSEVKTVSDIIVGCLWGSFSSPWVPLIRELSQTPCVQNVFTSWLFPFMSVLLIRFLHDDSVQQPNKWEMSNILLHNYRVAFDQSRKYCMLSRQLSPSADAAILVYFI